MTWILLTFTDLIFKQNKITKLNVATIEQFINGYGVRVDETIDGYNMIILKSNIEYHKTHLSKKQLTSLTKSQVTYYMEIIQRFGDQNW
jgi:hypothetical protein